jgi:hypothetical protein
VNVSSIRLLCLSFAIIPFCGASHTSSPLEFKQAIARYIKHTDVHYLQHAQRHADENEPYKKELRYLFKNYGNMSPSALLSRVRSAHQEMVKHESDMNSDVYKRYEQISSALLLICAQSFFYDVRTQILNALDEVDHLIMYWRYQQHHHISYFFGKSPHKWIMGKSQAKEIVYNLALLEHKQRELYTLLGVLAGHAHTLTTCDVTYEDCYQWMNALLTVLSQGYELLYSGSDGTQFDIVAAQLALRMKKVDLLAHDLLKSLNSARKPSHFVQNWIAYTVLLAAAGYVTYYYAHDYEVINANVKERLISLSRSWKDLVVNPVKDIWNTLSGKDDVSMIQESIKIEKGVSDFAQDINDLETKKDFNKKRSNALADHIQRDRENAQNLMVTLLNKKVTEGKISQERCDKIIAAEKIGDVTEFQKLFYDMDKTLTDFYWNDDILDAITVLAELKIYHYGSSLIQVVFELIVDYGIPAVKEALIVLSKGNRKWAATAKKLNLILNVAILTPTIIVGGAGCRGLYKTYTWVTAHDYSPIRIALADVNALLIESAAKFDDYAYGKLLYLIFKLRHRASALKDTLAHEFLNDVAKLELKQYDSETKHSIIENMFNKYAFLGRVNA